MEEEKIRELRAKIMTLDNNTLINLRKVNTIIEDVELEQEVNLVWGSLIEARNTLDWVRRHFRTADVLLAEKL